MNKPSASTPGKVKLLSAVRKRSAEHDIDAVRDKLLAAQVELHGSKRCALIVVLTGVPTAGRSEAVNELLEWVDPKHVSVHALDPKDPAARGRTRLWPYWIRVPARGRIAIFFDGWYERPLREALHKPKKARAREPREAQVIRRFEAMLVRNGVRLVKAHFTVDRETQRERLQALANDELTAARVTKEDLWLAKHHERFNREWQRWHELTEQSLAPWHFVTQGGHKERAAELGRLMLAALDESQDAAAVVPHEFAAVAEAPTLPPDPLPECSDAHYDRDLPKLQIDLALLTRKKRFRKRGLVLAFEGMDAAGKGGAIRRITHALDARQYRVVPVSAPTPEELLHPYLWRFWRETPRRGRTAIFDRSWYGRVLVERVRGFTPESDWQRAYDEIREFELELHEGGFVVKKFWLAVSEAAQLQRFQERESDPLKRFKVDPEDWTNRKLYADYQVAAAEMLARTHAEHAPWVVIPADDKKAARLEVLRSVVESLRDAI